MNGVRFQIAARSSGRPVRSVPVAGLVASPDQRYGGTVESLAHLQRTAGNRAVNQLLQHYDGGSTGPLFAAPLSSLRIGRLVDTSGPAPRSSSMPEPSAPVIQRVAGADDAVEAGALMEVLANCVAGALVTTGLDEIIQVGKWALFGHGKFRQNWCKTLFSALFGCVFGVAGGAFEKMIVEEGFGTTGSAVAQWIIRKLARAGFTQVSGKLALFLAKSGCDQAEQAVSDASSPDDGDTAVASADTDTGTTTSDDSGADDNQAAA